MQRSRPLHLLYPRPALRCLVTRRALCITSPAILRPTTLDVEPGRAPPELHRRFASRGPMCGAGSVVPEPLHIGVRDTELCSLRRLRPGRDQAPAPCHEKAPRP